MSFGPEDWVASQHWTRRRAQKVAGKLHELNERGSVRGPLSGQALRALVAARGQHGNRVPHIRVERMGTPKRWVVLVNGAEPLGSSEDVTRVQRPPGKRSG